MRERGDLITVGPERAKLRGETRRVQCVRTEGNQTLGFRVSRTVGFGKYGSHRTDGMVGGEGFGGTTDGRARLMIELLEGNNPSFGRRSDKVMCLKTYESKEVHLIGGGV